MPRQNGYEDFVDSQYDEAYKTLKIGNILPLEVRTMIQTLENSYTTIDLSKVQSVLSNEPFQLDPKFIKLYENKEPEWGELGWFVFKRTYSRRVEREDGTSIRTEEWYEVVKRVVEGNLSIIPNDPLATQEYAQKMYDQIFNLVWTPPGRGLWMSGTEFSKRTGDSSNNCWFIETRPWNYGEMNKIFKRITIDPKKKYVSYPFVFLFDQAMKGGGVGFSAEEKIIEEIPMVENNVKLFFYLDENHPDYEEIRGIADRIGASLNNHHIRDNLDTVLRVGDEREGWCEAQALTIDSHFMGDSLWVGIDLSEIRPRKTPIKGFGGVASGPAPLVEMLHFQNFIFNRRSGSYLTSVDVTDLHNSTGRAVVAGNVRRTAEIAFGAPKDSSFINAKNYRLVEHVVKGWDENGAPILKSVSDLIAEGYSEKKAEEDYYMAWAQSNHRWASNNSIVIDDPRGYDFGFISGAIAVNGEPGILNRWLSQNFGRIIDGYREQIDGRATGGNPCAEISLESTEPCNLVEYFLPVALRLGIPHEEIIPMMVQYAKRVTFSNYDWEQSAEVIWRNRRIGVSLSGVQDWILMKYKKGAIIGWKVYDKEDWDDQVWLTDDTMYVQYNGYQPEYDHETQYIEPVYNPDLLEEIDCLYKLVKICDIEYSHLLTKALGYEVSPSIKVTTNKPSGTVALLPFVSPGNHLHYFQYGVRLVRVQDSDPLLGLCGLAGYHTEPAVNNPGTSIIEFPVVAPSAGIEGFRSADEVTIEEQFALQALMTVYWADNMVSTTITFHEHEKDKIGHLLTQYRTRIKSTSLLPYSGHGYVQAPYQPCSKEEYLKKKKNIQWKPQELYHILMDKGGFEDKQMSLEDALECAGGHCPVK